MSEQGLPEGFIPSYDTCSGVSQICPVEASIYGYRPALGPNALFAAIHTILFFVQLFLGYRMKGYAFPTWLIIGIGLQMVGWYSRIALYEDVWNFNAMAASLAGLIICTSPSFSSSGCPLLTTAFSPQLRQRSHFRDIQTHHHLLRRATQQIPQSEMVSRGLYRHRLRQHLHASHRSWYVFWSICWRDSEYEPS